MRAYARSRRYGAIQNGDADLAEQCCIDHVKAAAVTALSMIERSSVSNEKAIENE